MRVSGAWFFNHTLTGPQSPNILTFRVGGVSRRLGEQTASAHFTSDARNLQHSQNRQQFLRVRTTSVIRIDLGVGDDALLVDYISRRHRKCPAWLAVNQWKLSVETLVDLNQLFLQSIADTELVSNIAQSLRIGKLRLFSRLDLRLFCCDYVCGSSLPDLR